MKKGYFIYNKMSYYNSKEALIEWVNIALNEAQITENEKTKLKEIGIKIINEGGWRGNISEAWKKLGYTLKQIPDMYL